MPFLALITPLTGGGAGPDNTLPGGPPLYPSQGPIYGGGYPGNALPGGPPVHPWFPIPGQGRPDQGLPGGGGHPWFPGHLGPIGGTLPIYGGGYPSHGLPGSPGHPGNALPIPPFYPSNELPGSGGHPWFPGHGSGGARPDQGLPSGGAHPWLPGHGSGGARPDQGLPGTPGAHPENPITSGGWVLIFHPAYGYVWVPASAIGGGGGENKPVEPAEPKDEDL